MNNAEFANCMNSLRDYYGAKAYPPKTESVIWRIVSHISRSEFEQVISSLVEEHKLPPAPAQVKKAALPYLRRAEEARRRQAVANANQERCKVCGDSGMLLALKRTEPDYEYSFACPYCRAADARQLRGIPTWSEDLKADFIPTSLKPDSHLAAKELQDRFREPQVCRSWEKRLQTHPHALKRLEGHGVVPDYLKTFLQDKGLGHLVPGAMSTEPTEQAHAQGPKIETLGPANTLAGVSAPPTQFESARSPEIASEPLGLDDVEF